MLAHRMPVRNVTGYPTWRGIREDECVEIRHLENIHFWPFDVKSAPDDPLCKWVNLNGAAFEIAHTDWLYVLNTSRGTRRWSPCTSTSRSGDLHSHPDRSAGTLAAVLGQEQLKPRNAKFYGMQFLRGR